LARLRAGVHFGSSILVKTLAGLIVIKLLAWKVGPDGFGVLGQLMTLVAIMGMFAGGGITNGLIKVLAKSSIDSAEGQAWAKTAFTVTTCVSAAMAGGLVVFSEFFSNKILQGGLSPVFWVLAITQALIAYGTLIQADTSSRGATGIFAFINIVGTVVGALVLVIGVTEFGYAGAAYTIVLMPAMSAVVALVFVLPKRRGLMRSFQWSLEIVKVKYLLSFSLITMIGAASVPLAQMMMRDFMAARFGWEQVGLWQGVIKLSDVYMQFVGVILINYALPRYSAREGAADALSELKSTLLWLLPLLMAGFAVFYVLRDVVVRIVFSEAFLPMSDYLIPQMIGDLLRTVASAISFFFIAKGLVRVSIVYELAQGVGVALVFILIFNATGKMAPVYAHLVTYAVLLAGLSMRLWVWSGKNRA
jgi:O-antigen/teichoic acid export membrane protein